MAYVTDRKRVTGLGSARGGTAQHWTITLTSVALLILTPFFLAVIGPLLGSPHAEVVTTLGKPIPALIVAAYLVIGMHHLRFGMQVMIGDYARGLTKKIAIIATTIISYGLAAGGLIALMQIAL
ncbi:MAG: succinate dehydrogenase [Roseicyclus sp.]|nr:succinate dehydrogenase [Roseicyclus sp.]